MVRIVEIIPVQDGHFGHTCTSEPRVELDHRLGSVPPSGYRSKRAAGQAKKPRYTLFGQCRRPALGSSTSSRLVIQAGEPRVTRGIYSRFLSAPSQDPDYFDRALRTSKLPVCRARPPRRIGEQVGACPSAYPGVPPTGCNFPEARSPCSHLRLRPRGRACRPG
jgi:hypothetical protein